MNAIKVMKHNFMKFQLQSFAVTFFFLTTSILRASDNTPHITLEPPDAESETTVELVLEGSGETVGENIVHANGNIYNQVLLTGERVTLRTDEGEITHVSFIDENDDIVQVEFSGNAIVTLSLNPNTFQPAAPPVKYNQPSVNYVKGRATVTVEEADENTFLSIFTVGSLNAVNQSLFPMGVDYDGMADVALLEISGNGIGGILTANTRFSDDNGFTGILADEVNVRYRATVGDIDARGSAVPTLVFGEGSVFENDDGAILIAGGNLVQSNGTDVTVSLTGSNAGFSSVSSRPNFKSNGTEQSAQIIPVTFTNLSGQIISVPVGEQSAPGQSAGSAPSSLDGKTYMAIVDGFPEFPDSYSFEGDTSGTFKDEADLTIEGIFISVLITGTFNYSIDINDPNRAFLTINIEYYSAIIPGILKMEGTPHELANDLLIPAPRSVVYTIDFISSANGAFVSNITYTDGTVYLSHGTFVGE